MLTDLINIHHANIAKINYNTSVPFYGIKMMQNDTFKKMSLQNTENKNNLYQNSFIFKEIESDEYEGYITFQLQNNSEQQYKALYEIDDAGNQPSYNVNDEFNGNLMIDYIREVKKVPDNTNTFIKQANKISIKTEAVAEIVENTDNGNLIAIADGIPIIICLNKQDATDYQIGNRIKVTGLLKVDFI